MNPRLTDQDMIDALVAYARKGGAVRVIAAPKVKVAKKKDHRIVMSRVAAKPVTSKVTQGYALKALKDEGCING
jgi:hypothetical protein